MNIVHVVGTGTIGLPLIGLLNRHKKDFGIDEVTFHKNTPLKNDIAGIKQLLKEGAVLSTDKEKFPGFKELGVEPKYTREEAISRSVVTLDCTPKGFGIKNKAEYYNKFKNTVKGFVAQGSESGFGTPFAYDINNETLTKDDQFIQVVSCNTHNICAIVSALWDISYPGGDFLCIRRASDISQNADFVAGLEVDPHKYEGFGSHHARDADRVFKTLGGSYTSLFSSSCVIPSQYMHAIYFSMRMFSNITLNDVLERFSKNKLIALTNKTTTNSVFSFGRDYGHYGRLLNQTVIVKPTLWLPQDGEGQLRGFCFTPQDANSLMSSVASCLWFLYKDWSVIKEKMSVLDKYLFDEI